MLLTMLDEFWRAAGTPVGNAASLTKLQQQVEWIREWEMEGLEGRNLHSRYREALLVEAKAAGVSEQKFDSFASEHLLGMNISGIRRWLGQQKPDSPS